MQHSRECRLAEIAKLYKEQGKTLWLIGAGFSADAGIPSDKIFWEPPLPLNPSPEDLWRAYRRQLAIVASLKPTGLHKALGKVLSYGGPESIVATTLVDGLLSEALGRDKVIEIYGSLKTLRCVSCGSKYSLSKTHLTTNELPRCPKCSAQLVPDIVIAGSEIPSRRLVELVYHATSSDMAILLGYGDKLLPSSLIPVIAWRSGAVLVNVNIGSTVFDSISRYKCRMRVSVFLEKLLRELEA